MSILQFVNLAVCLFGSLLISIITYRVFHAWLKYKEEALIHLTLIFGYSSSLIILLGLLIFLNQNILLGKEEIAFIGVFYSIFYLEFAFFYLSLFANRSNVLEKYIPVIMSLSIAIDATIVILNNTDLINLAILLTSIVIFLGLYLVFQTYRRFKSTENYFHGEKDSCEKDFVIKIKTILLYVFILFFVDGLGFISLFSLNIIVDDLILIIPMTVVAFSTIITYILSNKMKDITKSCDITHIFNTLS